MRLSKLLILFIVLMSMASNKLFAYDIAVENADGVTIYYNYINDGKELEVRKNYKDIYKGNVVIPEEVTYMNRTRKVTSIYHEVFEGCKSLTSVTIPNSVTFIGGFAFKGCSSLTSVYISDVAAWCNIVFAGDNSNPLYQAHHLYLNGKEVKDLIIPNSVTSIGNYAFSGCSNLNSVTISNSVTSIGSGAFGYCSCLTSLIIPNSVTTIGDGAFKDCSGLTSIVISNSVTSIGDNTFEGCSGLTSVTIPNSVTFIGNSVYAHCESLTSLIIGNNVETIGNYTFNGCKSLTSVTIPNSVTSIGDNAFSDCEILTIISLIENPFIIYSSTFTNNTYKNATLFIPKGTIDKYKATEGWKDFLYIEEGTGPNGGGGETPKKCSTPTISYQNGKLIFNCDTEGVTYQYSITDDDVKSGSSNEIKLGVTYCINVYATKTGYVNSETATATLCWIDTEPKTEGITNVAQVRARAVMIQSNGNVLSVSGADEGTEINVYDTTGKKVGSSVATSDVTNIPTSLNSGSIGIIKIGEKAVKVLIK